MRGLFLATAIKYLAMPRRRRYPPDSRGVRLVHSPADIRGDHCVLMVKSSDELDAVLTLAPSGGYRRVWGLCAPFVIRSEILPALIARFERIAWFDSPDHISQAKRKAIERHDSSVILGSLFDGRTGTLSLMRCDLSCAIIPRDLAHRIWGSRDQRPELSDDGTILSCHGRNILVVEVLATVDPVFRREYRRRMWAQQRDMGSRIRHLRKLRGARREDFPGVTAKTVARIERGEIKNPQKETLRLIALYLGMKPDELLASPGHH